MPPTAWSRQHHLIDLTAAGPSGRADAPPALPSASQDDTVRADDVRAELLAAPSLAARQALAENHVAGRLRALLRLRARRIDPAARFSDLGLDSLHAVRLRNDLQSALEIAIPLEAIWSNASARALGAFLAAEVSRERAVHDVPAAAPSLATGGEARFVDLPAGRFRYLRWGSSGLPQAVLLHANAGSAASWARVGAALAGDYEVFALDLRGHGASRPAARGSLGLRAAADDVVDFFGALELDTPLLVGHSWGAAVALVLASGAESASAPPRLSGLVLEDPPPSLSADSQHDRVQSLLATLALSPEDMLETLVVTHPDWDPGDRATMVEGWLQASAEVASSLVAEGARSGPLLALLAKVSAPTLLVRADARRGTLLPDTDWHAAKRLLDKRSDAVEIAGATHEVHRSRPEDFLAAVRAFTASEVVGAMRLASGGAIR